MDEYQKLTKTLGNIKKNCRSYKKNAKTRDIKKLKSIPILLETMQCPITNLKGDRLVPETKKTQKNDEKFQKPEKNANLFKKIAKISDIKKLKPIPCQLKIFQ